MEFDFNMIFTALLAAAIPTAAVFFSNWRNKVKLDGVQDWQDYLIDIVEGVFGIDDEDLIEEDFDDEE